MKHRTHPATDLPAGAGGLPAATQVHPVPAAWLTRADLPDLLDALPSTHHGGRYHEVRTALVDYLRHRAQHQAALADVKGTQAAGNLAVGLARFEKAGESDLQRLETALSAYLGRLRIPLLDSRAEPEMEQLLQEVRGALMPTHAGLIVLPTQAELEDDEGDDELDAPDEAAFRNTSLLQDASDDEGESDAGPVGQTGPLVRSVATWHLPAQAGLQSASLTTNDQITDVQGALQAVDDTQDPPTGEVTPASQPVSGTPVTSEGSGTPPLDGDSSDEAGSQSGRR